MSIKDVPCSVLKTGPLEVPYVEENEQPTMCKTTSLLTTRSDPDMTSLFPKTDPVILATVDCAILITLPKLFIKCESSRTDRDRSITSNACSTEMLFEKNVDFPM